MISKNLSIFVFVPYLKPTKSSAALRGESFKFFFEHKFKEIALTTSSDFPLFPQNTDHNLIRLFKETLCGIILFFKVFFSNCDFYFFSSPPFIISLLGASAALLKRKNYIFDVRDLYPETYLSYSIVKENNPFYKLTRYWTKVIYKKSYLTTTVTNSLVENIKKDTSNVLLIRNGYDEDTINYKMSEKFKTFTCIYHGNLGKFQKIELIIKLAEELPHVNFIIAGSGPKKTILEKTILPNLSFEGELSRKDVLSLVSKSHLGLSFLEDGPVGENSFPVKVYEYLALELPVLLTPKGEASHELEILNLGKGFSNDSINEITSYIQEISQNQSKYQAISSTISLTKKNFERKKQIEKLNFYL